MPILAFMPIWAFMLILYRHNMPNMGLNAYMGMNANTFMLIIDIYAYMRIYYIGISFMPTYRHLAYIGINVHIGMNAYVYRHKYPYG